MTERDAILTLAERVAEILDGAMRGIVPERVYTPEEAADLIGIRSGRKAKVIRKMPIPFIEIIPGGRTFGYRGRDLIRYLDEQTRGAA